MKNNEFVSLLNEFNSFAILPHVFPDGDTLGSSFAIFQILKNLGKKAYIVLDDEIPYNLKFALNEKVYKLDEFLKENFEFETVIAVDSSDVERMGGRKILFEGKKSICIDHHITNTKYCDFNFVDSGASSTGEVLFNMVFDDYSEIDSVTASYIYMAILTDTGSFKYASTTARTLDIAAALYRAGIDFENINIEIYQNITLGKFKFTNLILNSLELYRSNKIGFVFITNNILKNNGLIMEDTDGIIEMVRDISDVEIAIFAREVEDGVFKISLRSKRYYDVAELSLKFNGGGHKRAAGFTLYGTIDEIRDAILNEIEI